MKAKRGGCEWWEELRCAVSRPSLDCKWFWKMRHKRNIYTSPRDTAEYRAKKKKKKVKGRGLEPIQERECVGGGSRDSFYR